MIVNACFAYKVGVLAEVGAGGALVDALGQYVVIDGQLDLLDLVAELRVVLEVIARQVHVVVGRGVHLIVGEVATSAAAGAVRHAARE